MPCEEQEGCTKHDTAPQACIKKEKDSTAATLLKCRTTKPNFYMTINSIVEKCTPDPNCCGNRGNVDVASSVECNRICPTQQCTKDQRWQKVPPPTAQYGGTGLLKCPAPPPQPVPELVKRNAALLLAQTTLAATKAELAAATTAGATDDELAAVRAKVTKAAGVVTSALTAANYNLKPRLTWGADGIGFAS